LFQGNTIGSAGILNDTQNVPEMLYLIQKKFFGLANTLPDLIITAETFPNSIYKIPNAFPYIHQNKIYSQFVPLSNPLISDPFDSISIDLNKCYKDITFSNFNQERFFGKTMLTNQNSSKYISFKYPYIAFYSNILLTSVTKTATSLYSSFATSYGHPLLQNTISGFYDLNYMPHLYYSNTGSEIVNNDGSWLLDTDAGVVTFYDNNNVGNQVSVTNPPLISFYRYEGLIGEASILQGQDL
jgi:hypothetical protein